MTTSQLSSKYSEIPDWVVIGESVLIRPYNTSGVVSFIGPTHFQVKFIFAFKKIGISIENNLILAWSLDWC